MGCWRTTTSAGDDLPSLSALFPGVFDLVLLDDADPLLHAEISPESSTNSILTSTATWAPLVTGTRNEGVGQRVVESSRKDQLKVRLLMTPGHQMAWLNFQTEGRETWLQLTMGHRAPDKEGGANRMDLADQLGVGVACPVDTREGDK